MDQVTRCTWAGEHPLMQDYHDTQWGVPTYDDQTLFEFLILESAQAGLSWRTILDKRDGYRQAFDNFNPQLVAEYDETKRAELVANPAIVRNQRKIDSAISNARAFLEVQSEYGSFSDYIWSFVNHSPIHNHWQDESEVPAETKLSQQISADLKRRGFSFVGPTIIYSYMQAVGMVDDHTIDCFCYQEQNQQAT